MLNSYKNIQLIESNSAKQLVESLSKIRFPYNIIKIYSDGKKHYAIINTDFKLKIIKNNKVQI